MEKIVKPPWDGVPYSVKRHGVSVTNCDSEPVQTPGCIQGHGVLFVLEQSNFIIKQVSENVGSILGVSAAELLNTPFAALIGPVLSRDLEVFVEHRPVDRAPHFFATLALVAGSFDVTVHTLPGVVVVELEPSIATGDRVDFSRLRATITRLQNASSLAGLCDVITDEVRDLTGFDRVMVYRFHADLHGEVIAESKTAGIHSWLGLHYPAEDIPLPAREVFMRVWSRPVSTIPGTLAEMVPLTHPSSGKALEMTFCALRGPSVMYTEYLQNMGVTAAYTLALRQGDALWGLIACHHYTEARQVHHSIRSACEIVAQVASLQLKMADEREHVDYRLRIEQAHHQLMADAARSGDVLTLVRNDEPNVLSGVKSTGAALRFGGHWHTCGTTPSHAQLDALATWIGTQLSLREDGTVYATSALSQENADTAVIRAFASGVLAIPLARERGSMLLWFRPETLETISWAGDPHAKPVTDGPNGPRLTPRASFELFAELMRGKASPWLDVEIEAAMRLRSNVLELVVDRSEQIAALNTELRRSNEELDAFAYVASHDLKEPLRGIHKYAYQLAHESSVTDDADLAKVASVARLALRMDGLLESLLHFSRVGRSQLVRELCDLNEVFAEAVEMAVGRLDSTTRIEVVRHLPTLNCDRVRVREIFLNLITNAVKYNDKAHRIIEVGAITAREVLERPAGVSGDVLFVRDNGIGIQSRHFDAVFKMFRRLHARDAFGGGSGAGLTIVKQLVERHCGKIWLASTPGAGTTFYFTLSEAV